MRLRADHDGITTWDDPPVRPSRGRLDHDHARVDVAGLTFAETATAVGLTAPPLDQVYRDGPHVSTNERVMLDPTEVAVVEDALHLGYTALRYVTSTARG